MLHLADGTPIAMLENPPLRIEIITGLALCGDTVRRFDLVQDGVLAAAL